MRMSRKNWKWYVGIDNRSTFPGQLGSYQAFRWYETPSAEQFSWFSAVIGPFKTKRGAQWAEKYGRQNPHFQHVDDAEQLAKLI